MYTIEIEKNYFCDTLHPYPRTIGCPNKELFLEISMNYRLSLKEHYSDAFDIKEVEKEKCLRFSLSPSKVPDNFLIHEVCFYIKTLADVQVFWDYYSDDKVKALHAEKFSDLISVVYGMLAFSMNKQANDIKIKVRETEYAHVVEIEGSYIFSENSLAVLLTDKYMIKYHLVNDTYRVYAPKHISDLSEDIVVDGSQESDANTFLGETTDNHARLSFDSKEEDEQLHLYDFLDHYELDELIELLSEINSMILLLTSSKFSNDEVDLLIRYLSSMAKILNASHESFALGMNITLLFNAIDNNRETFLESSSDMAHLCGGFSHDISEWLKKLFFEGASSLHFLDDSIISNAQTIISFLEAPAECAEVDVDDVFDF